MATGANTVETAVFKKRVLSVLQVSSMESLDGKQNHCKSKIKLKPMELEVLVEEPINIVLSYGKKNLNITKRNAAWEKICEKVKNNMKLRKDGKI